ncbi:hypothetical protein NC796_07410 [Aliifodinibius sp. S!AR15-10]|uniref:hypothetical protein n=1 Tax=Aliifodinibius sp. S!AR15-10 TaxID=2950437 RepID=UPI00285E80B0|nr:hypothetical protein [Aliifodinibius sp. S!AR15-10]MDR8390959.1 hypothetical protein [Aliifodinibius sp. S!AR15-10]
MTCRLIAVSILSFVSIMLPKIAYAQHSVARQWNEILLESIRSDFARPTVHARNLYHASIAMYDGWAVYDYVAKPYFLGKTVGGYYCPFDGITTPADIEKAREETISYAVFRLLRHRFKQSPGADQSFARFDSLMRALGFDPSFSSTSYSSGGRLHWGIILLIDSSSLACRMVPMSKTTMPTGLMSRLIHLYCQKCLVIPISWIPTVGSHYLWRSS